MDELMAAMVLSSLSCSPLLHSPAHSHTGTCAGTPRPRPPASGSLVSASVSASVNGCGGGEPSEDASDNWACFHGNGSPIPSPVTEEVTSSLATPTEEGTDVDLDLEPLDEPAVRKRRVSEAFDWLVANETPPL